tara:strand:- start:56631 stop:57164 length:534 start_codon:yes stop_codon:yes gene_type:complete
MLHYLRFLVVACLFFGVPLKAHAQGTALTQQSIESFYKDLVEAKIAGGTYLVSFHNKHYSDDLRLILSLRRTVEGNEMPKSFLDHDKATFIAAIKNNDKIIDHLSGDSKIVDVSIDDGGKSANVRVELLSNFTVQPDKMSSKRDGEEKMICEDKLVLSDTGMIQIASSNCDVRVALK